MKKHGLCHSRIYGIWNGIIQRCENPNRKAYSRYGGRGISVCKDWHDFQAFRDWALSNGYLDNLTIDRIDVNGNYEPTNCRWATPSEQSNNRRTNVIYEIDGVLHSLKEWSEIYGMPYKTVHARIHRNNWDIVSALTVSPKRGTKHGRYALHR